jgi:hypothetical protein
MLFTTYMLPKGAFCVKAFASFAVFVRLDGSILKPLHSLPPDDKFQDGPPQFACVWSTCLLLGAERARIF